MVLMVLEKGFYLVSHLLIGLYIGRELASVKY